jgi:hypothetical protein
VSVTARIWAGGTLGLIPGVVIITYLSGTYMDAAERVTGEPFGWPQIGFMSAYPDHIRNGYFMFVAAVASYIILASGLCTAIFGASPGKALLGIKYAQTSGAPARLTQIIARMTLILLLAAFVLLAGPVLGFVFGPAADRYSLAALGLGLCIAIAALAYVGPDGLTWVNCRARLRPFLRNSLNSKA